MLAYSSRSPDPAIVGEAWRGMWLERLENQPFLLNRMASPPAPRRLLEARVRLRGLFVHRKPPSCRLAAGTTAIATRSRIWFPTCAHRSRASSGRGSTSTRTSPARSRRSAFCRKRLRWWDRWLKDIDTGVESDPAMRLWLMESVKPEAWLEERPGRWIACPQWPSPEIASRTLHLVEGALTGEPGPGGRSISSPADLRSRRRRVFPVHVRA